MYLLDTHICIYIINRRPENVIAKIKTLEPAQILLSAISLAELEYGVAKSKHKEKNRNALLGFATAFGILPFDSRDAEVFGLIRANLEKRGQVIGAYDMQIAAQAVARNLTLVSNNTAEFARIPSIRLENWTQELGDPSDYSR